MSQMSIQDSNPEIAILRTLVYFDIFEYPLTLDELYYYNSLDSLSMSNLFDIVHNMVQDDRIRSKQDYYFLPGQDHLVELRQKRAKRARKLLVSARQSIRYLVKIPFVRGIYLSGDLSKGVANHAQSDVDFFIVVSAHRVYVTKLFLAIFRRIRRFNPNNLYCFNYIVSESHLAIYPQSLYSAYELSGLYVLHNNALLERLYECNDWVRHFVPRYREKHGAENQTANEPCFPIMQKWMEFPLKLFPGFLLDRMLRQGWRLGWWIKYRRDHKTRLLLIQGAQSEYCKAHGHRTDLRVMQALQERYKRLGLSSHR